jgi:RNA polymerase sigma-70 factor (ECF subfamily)
VANRVDEFRLLYDAGYPRIVAFALRRARTPDEGYDIVSETFMTAWRRFDDAPPEEAWMAWLYGIARRTLSNHYRADDRRRRLQERLENQPARGVEAEGPAIVGEAMGALGEDDREILTMAAWDDMTNEEIAGALGISPGTAAVRLHRARKRLAKELGRRGYPPGAATMQETGESRTLPEGTQRSIEERPA